MQIEGITKKDYLISIIIIIMSEMMYIKETVLYSSEIVLGDNIIYLFYGMEIFKADESGFKIPIMFLINYSTLLYLFFKSSVFDRDKIGVQRLIRLGSKKKWWILVNIRIAVISATFFISKVVVALLVCRDLKMDINKGFINDSCNIIINSNNNRLCVFSAIIIPLVTIVVIGMVMQLISFFIKPYASCILAIIFLVCSTFFFNKWFIGEYLFWGRSSLADLGGYDIKYSILVDIIWLSFILAVGIMCIEKKDYDVK